MSAAIVRPASACVQGVRGVSLPVMVCMDGFILTHAVERVDMPSRQEVDALLPPFAPR
jgi:pyruvate/2-oxoacid:ferredoxin oxidoreductase alpha subunit